MLLSSCSIGSYSLSTGKADECMLSFVAADNKPISVTVDNTGYELKPVKTKAWKKARDIKATALNTIILTPGPHDVKVVKSDGTEFVRKVYISVQEHKVIEL